MRAAGGSPSSHPRAARHVSVVGRSTGTALARHHACCGRLGMAGQSGPGLTALLLVPMGHPLLPSPLPCPPCEPPVHVLSTEH